MSIETNQVCCNCSHNIRTGNISDIECHCDVDGSYIGYYQCMANCCEHWSEEQGDDEQ